jgi:ABC-2 type transport system permease protein
MTLLAAVLKLSAWDTHESLTLLACSGYVVLFAGIGIRWFQWDSR